jgi:capsular polysaccharide biosynthesis protein
MAMKLTSLGLAVALPIGIMGAIGIPFLVAGFGKPISQERPVSLKANWMTHAVPRMKNPKKP